MSHTRPGSAFSAECRSKRIVEDGLSSVAVPPSRCLVDRLGSLITDIELDMSKPCLRLVHCSDRIRPQATRRHRRSFRVIQGGARARSVPSQSSWAASLELISLGFLIACQNYLAFLQASTTALEAHSGTDQPASSERNRAK
jgi:hypothetical protein